MRNIRPIVIFALVFALTDANLIATTNSNSAAEGLKSSEYAAVGVIYNNELSTLGRRALYPICIELPTGISEKILVKFLQGAGYPVSNPSLCEPGMARRGKNRPKDYTHGMRIYLNNPERDSDGTIRIQVQVSDLTVRPGEHFAALLRDGVYDLKLDAKGEWQTASYTKKYDAADEKHGNCDNIQPVTQP